VYYSDFLSSKAARTLQGGALKAVQIGKPFKAIWQPTVTDEFLGDFLPADGYNGVQKPLRTLSGEIRRFWELVVCWAERHGYSTPVMECAEESTSDGQREYHPHPHILTSLAVPRHAFPELCQYVEAAWGLGSVHMEIIRQPANASKYLLKAVQYSVKGAQEGQGRVWGRRWGISRDLRVLEVRNDVEGSEGDALRLEEVATMLRDMGMGRVQTPFGSVTPRGFYPSEGYGCDSVMLAVLWAREELQGVIEEVIRRGSMDSEGVPIEAAETPF